MDINETESSMSFVMPSEYDIKSLPRPNDAKVEIHESPSEYAAAIEFGGYANDETISKYAEQLKKSLERKGHKNHRPLQVPGIQSALSIDWKKK